MTKSKAFKRWTYITSGRRVPCLKDTQFTKKLLTKNLTRLATRLRRRKIEEYQAKHPKRDDKQKRYLSCLWLELAFWQ